MHRVAFYRKTLLVIRVLSWSYRAWCSHNLSEFERNFDSGVQPRIHCARSLWNWNNWIDIDGQYFNRTHKTYFFSSRNILSFKSLLHFYFHNIVRVLNVQFCPEGQQVLSFYTQESRSLKSERERERERWERSGKEEQMGRCLTGNSIGGKKVTWQEDGNQRCD